MSCDQIRSQFQIKMKNIFPSKHKPKDAEICPTDSAAPVIEASEVAEISSESDAARVIRNLKKLDARRRVNISTINAEKRNEIAIALINACKELEITRGTLFLAIKMLDFVISDVKEPTLLDGAASLLMALKMEELDRTDMTSGIGQKLDLEPKDIVAHEVLVFQKLEFDSYFATPANFLWQMLQGESAQVVHYTNTMAMAASLSVECSQYLSEEVANACILIARQLATGKLLNDVTIDADNKCAYDLLAAARFLQESGEKIYS